MAYSPLPLINYKLWVTTRRFLSPFAQDCALSVNSQEEGASAFGDKTWTNDPSTEKSQSGIWFAALSLSTLVAIMYSSVLASLAHQWWQDPNYGHGFFVPVFAGYVLWSARSHLRALPLRPSNLGFVIMLCAIGLRVLGMLGAELFITRL